jgi:hypothetical protein
MYYSYVEIEYVATSFSPARTDLAVKLLIDVHLANKPQPYFFEEEFKYLHYTTPFFVDGHKRAVYNFLVTGQHCDYFLFLVTINADMTSFMMKTSVSPIFLNIMMRAVGELNCVHPDTNAILAGMHEMTNILILEVGGDFKLVWSKGNVYPLVLPERPQAVVVASGLRQIHQQEEVIQKR